MTIDGNGARLVMTDLKHAVRLSDCRNVTVKNLTVDYDPLPFTQGVITSVSPDSRVVEFTIDKGYPDLTGPYAVARMHLFTADEAVVTYGKLAMRWFCPFYFLLSILHGLAGAVRGTGASNPPMVVLLVSLCLFRVVWIQFLLPFFSGIEGVFILYPVSWGLGALLMILYAWKGKWMEYHT